MNDDITTVRLKNGTEELSQLVSVTMITIQTLFDSADLTDALALYDLAKGAKDATYDMSFTRRRLAGLGLLDAGGRMHQSIRNIAASALTVEGGTVTLTSPKAPAPGC